jgi:hypothetical protein
MSAICLHTRTLQMIERRVDALLQVGQDEFPLVISGHIGGGTYVVMEAKADYTAARVKYNYIPIIYYECISSQLEIKEFFETCLGYEQQKRKAEFTSSETYISPIERRITVMEVCGVKIVFRLV